ncbi:MAG: hypothetical protein IPM29_15125 [Planctomycetes bacterium]|nr:hypothetical protein [Planctomycetota bacterium]
MRTAITVTVVLAAVAVAVIALLDMDPTGARGARTGTRYVEEARAAAAIDPALVGWDESAPPLAVAMDAPCGLAVGVQDRVIVVGDRLVILAADGAQVLRSAPLPGGYRAVAVDGRGRIVAGGGNRVDVLDARADDVRVARHFEVAGDGARVTAVAISSEWIFAADAGRCTVQRLPADASETARFEPVAGGFFVPSTMDLTVSPAGELTTVDPGRHLVQVRDGYGDVIRSFGRRGGQIADFHGCCNPIAIAVTAAGQVVTAEKGLATTRVKVYAPDGELDSVVAGPDRFDAGADGPPVVLDVAVDSRGRVLVLDPARRQVRIFTRKAQ